MAHRQTCLVASDEEDEDGNLYETAPLSKSESVPVGEVVYLTEDTSNFQPEGEEIDHQQLKQQQKVSGIGIKVKTIDSLRKTPRDQENYDKSINIKSKVSDGAGQQLVVESSSTEKTSNTFNTGNMVKKSDPLKADNQMPLPIKRDNENVGQSNNFKKAKYARQATPICDAIMKEYSKRQRVIKQKGSGPDEVSDMPIQELLKKAKDKGDPEMSDENEVSSTNERSKAVKLNALSEEVVEGKISDPLTIVKQEIIDVKPEVIYVPADSIEVKQEILTSAGSSPKSNQTASDCARRGRGRGRPSRVGSQKKRKWQISDDEDDTDEDPDFDPHAVSMKTRRVTRSSRRTALKHTPNPQEEYMCDTQGKDLPDSHVPDSSQNDKSLESVTNPNEKAERINLAEQLKYLAEEIADILTKDPSPNINSEAEKLLHTTQELIEMQKKTLRDSEEISFTPGSTIQIKQEIIIDTPENYKETSSQSLVESTITNTPDPSQHSVHNNSLQIYNQLQRHEAALQKKLSESVSSNDQILNITTAVTPPNLPNTENVISGPVSIKEKCTFIMDFFTSYQEVFDEYTVNCVIPTLSDNIMLCVNELTECIQRTKRAESFISTDLKQQEINLAKKSYLKTIMSSGEKFFPLFNHVVEKITKTKTSKALVNTLILYIAGSLFMKTPKLKSHMHRLRRVLLFMTKAHQYYQQIVSQVLQTPNDVFDSETKLIRHLLKYFQARKFLKIPAEFLCNYPDVSVEEEQQFQAELSITDTAVLEHINPCASVVDRPVEKTQSQNYYKQLGISSLSALTVNNQSRRSNITAEFVEALQSEQDGNTKRIEQKLDYILNVLSSNGESLGKNMNTLPKNLKKPQMRLEKGITDFNQPATTTANFNVRVNLGQRVPNFPTVKLNPNQEPNTMLSGTSRLGEPASLPDDKGMLLAQLLENDNVGLDSLFSSYLKSSTERSTVRVKTEPVDVDSSIETTEISAQQILIPVKQELNEEYLTETGTTQPISSHVNERSLLGDAIFDDSFTEEYNFTKQEQDLIDVDPFS